MKKEWLVKSLALGIIVLFISSGVVSAFNVGLDNYYRPLNRGNWLYVGGSGEGNYTRIQDAIDNASDGDTVFVFDDSSPYYGRVTVTKSINLIGEDKDTTVIDNNLTGGVVSIYSDWVNISGFTIKKSGYATGISIHSNHTIIAGNNIISNNGRHSIYLCESSNNNIITDNNFTNSGDIFLSHSSGNIITGNNNFEINLYYTCKNIITNNNISSNLGNGISLFDSDDNNITGNNVSNNKGNGVYLYISNNNNIAGNNIISNNYDGLLLDESSGNIITGNNISSQIGDYGYGIDLEISSNNNIITSNNIILNKNGGISITDSSNNNWISGNLISNSTFGIDIQGCNDNKILNNTIENNKDVGISLVDAQYTMVSGNIIRNNGMGYEFNCGIILGDENCCYNTVSGNIISNNNPTGIYVSYAFDNVITGNNFIDNYGPTGDTPEKWWGNVYFCLPFRFKSLFHANSWDNNFWSDYKGFGVKIIPGDIEILGSLLMFGWFQFDWHPAKKPYDIGV